MRRWVMGARSLLLGVMMVAAAGPALAEPTDPLSPAEMRNGPSLRETGRIAGLPIQPLAPAPATIQPVPDLGDRGEKSIAKLAAEVDRPPPRRVGTIDPA